MNERQYLFFLDQVVLFGYIDSWGILHVATLCIWIVYGWRIIMIHKNTVLAFSPLHSVFGQQNIWRNFMYMFAYCIISREHNWFPLLMLCWAYSSSVQDISTVYQNLNVRRIHIACHKWRRLIVAGWSYSWSTIFLSLITIVSSYASIASPIYYCSRCGYFLHDVLFLRLGPLWIWVISSWQNSQMTELDNIYFHVIRVRDSSIIQLKNIACVCDYSWSSGRCFIVFAVLTFSCDRNREFFFVGRRIKRDCEHICIFSE